MTTFFKDTAETFTEKILPKAQTSTNPTQPRALRATPRNHQRLTRANTQGLIPTPLQNYITKTYKGEKRTPEGTQPTSEGVNPPKQTASETWYSHPRKRINIRQTEKRFPRQRSPRLHPIQADTSPMVVEVEHTVEALQTPIPTHTPQKPMIIEEDPAVTSPTRNNRTSLHTPRMITQEALQAVAFDIMTHRLSSFTPSKMK